MSTVEVKNIGPVEHITIPIPEGGGVVVLHGRNGTGKSSTLDAVDSALIGKGALSVRDGALVGEVEAFGAKLTVGRSTRRSGQLEVSSLEGKLSIAELVDPGLKSDDAADAKRIKALVSLTGADAKASEFHSLVGGAAEFERLVSPSATDTDDYVVMADRVKRELEKHAREYEDRAENLHGRASGMREGLDIAGVSDIPDASYLQQQLIEATKELQDCESRRIAWRQAKEQESRTLGQIDALKAKLERVADGLDDRLHEAHETLHQRAIEHANSVAVVKTASQDVSRLEQELSIAKQHEYDAKGRCNNALESVRIAEAALSVVETDRDSHDQTKRTIAELQESLKTSVENVTDEAIASAKEQVDTAQQLIERAAVQREQLTRHHQAIDLSNQAGELRKRAAEIRNAAKNTDVVLSSLVAKTCDLLRVEHGRLVLQTRRGTTYFGELSHGERWKLAMDVALNVIGNRGVIVIPQEAWEGCDDFARQAISEHAKLRGVLVLTAECSRQAAITAEVFEGDLATA